MSTVARRSLILVILLSSLIGALKADQSRLELTGHSGPVTSVAFSPSGDTLATASGDGTVRLWEARTGKLLHILKAHEKGVVSMRFHPNGETIESVCSDHAVKVWEIATGNTVAIFSVNGQPPSLVCALSPDFRLLALKEGQSSVALWDMAGGKKLRVFTHDDYDEVTAIAFSPDGRALGSAVIDGTIRVWEIASGKERLVLQGPLASTVVRFSPDGGTLAAGSGLGFIKTWSVYTGKERSRLGSHEGGVTCLALSPNNITLASGALDKSIRLWNLSNGKNFAILDGHMNIVQCLAFKPDGKALASGGLEMLTKVWDLPTGGADLAIRKAIADLRGKNTEARDKASESLSKLDVFALPFLRNIDRASDFDLEQRLKKLIVNITEPIPPPKTVEGRPRLSRGIEFSAFADQDWRLPRPGHKSLISIALQVTNKGMLPCRLARDNAITLMLKDSLGRDMGAASGTVGPLGGQITSPALNQSQTYKLYLEGHVAASDGKAAVLFRDLRGRFWSFTGVSKGTHVLTIIYENNKTESDGGAPVWVGKIEISLSVLVTD